MIYVKCFLKRLTNKNIFYKYIYKDILLSILTHTNFFESEIRYANNRRMDGKTGKIAVDVKSVSFEWGTYAVSMTIALILLDILKELREWKK